MVQQAKRQFRNDLYWLHRNKFYSITPFSGLVFINAARNKWEIVFWYIIVVVFGVITVKNVWNLTEQLAQRRTITKMSISKANGSYYFPNSTLCINAKLPDFSPYFYQRWNAYYDSDLNISEFREINLTRELTKALTKLTTKKRFLRGHWDYILLPLAYRYFYFLFASEVQPFVDYVRWKPTDDDFNFAPEPFWGTPPAGNATRYLIKYAQKLNISDMELADKFKEQLWRWFRGSIFYLSNAGQFFVSPMPYKISWMDETRICFDFNFNDIASSVQVSINMGYPAQAMKHFVGPNNFVLLKDYFVKQTSLSLFPSKDVPPVIASLRDGFPELHAPFQQDKEITLRVSASYHTIGSCSRLETMYECQGRCRSTLIYSVCGCAPFTYTRDKTAKGVCTMERYLKCLQYNSSMEEECMARCLPHCDKLSYKVEEKLLHATETETWMTLRISGHLTEYPVFTEEYAETWENYIAQLGGIIDFWLGASVIGIIHLIIHLLKQLAYCFNTSTTTGVNIRRMLNTENQAPAPVQPFQNARRPTISSIPHERLLTLPENVSIHHFNRAEQTVATSTSTTFLTNGTIQPNNNYLHPGQFGGSDIHRNIYTL